MAGAFIEFWNPAYIESPVLLNGLDREVFWIVIHFIEGEFNSSEVYSSDSGCHSVIRGAKGSQRLDFSHLSDHTTRLIRQKLSDWSLDSHPYWSEPISWNQLGGFGVALTEPSTEAEALELADRARKLGRMISDNLVCAENN